MLDRLPHSLKFSTLKQRWLSSQRMISNRHKRLSHIGLWMPLMLSSSHGSGTAYSAWGMPHSIPVLTGSKLIHELFKTLWHSLCPWDQEAAFLQAQWFSLLCTGMHSSLSLSFLGPSIHNLFLEVPPANTDWVMSVCSHHKRSRLCWGHFLVQHCPQMQKGKSKALTTRNVL